MLITVVLKVIWKNKVLELEVPDQANLETLLAILAQEVQSTELFVVYNGKIVSAETPLIAGASYQVYPSISGG